MCRIIGIATALCLLVIVLLAQNVSLGMAQEQTKSCAAVDRMATLTYSSKLIVSMAENISEKTCDFFVSLPPPSAVRASVTEWFSTAAKLDLPSLVGILSDLAWAPVTKKNEELHKAVQLRIEANSDQVTTCVAKLIDKVPFAVKSKDGQFSCDVSVALQQVVFRVAVGANFVSTVALPRPT